jgi:hypothetical protein
MAKLADRFEAKVDRTGEHHLWAGAEKIDGTGEVKVGGRIMSAQRVAWDLSNGPVPAGAVVLDCSDARAWVRVEHLSLRGPGDRRPGTGQCLNMTASG